jgi:hypothetical protein
MVSPVHGDYRRCQAEIPLIALSKFPRPALTYDFRLGQGVYFVKVALAGRLRHKFFDALVQRAFDNQIWVRPLGIRRSLITDRPPFSQNGGSAEINKIRIFHDPGFRALAS